MCVCLLLKHAGLTAAKETLPQTPVYNPDFSPSPAIFGLRFGISHNLFRQEGSHNEYKRRGASVRKQDTTRRGQKKWHMQLLTIHYDD